ncbi:hypothetical protein [Homoserinibacter sp. YIM 151385]|uniref:hypothetical protein n=1 Tax=Homoserinibacter sp. YIM 151385 TaxID=2985506 RepID=UPI0022EFF2A6|nr:hypothetical protein [Homoserinibacter sp. YIM 151385]WBU39311.1 hypothetical protein OF852_06965 [Homoserinibacter sp. YIM 151385]
MTAQDAADHAAEARRTLSVIPVWIAALAGAIVVGVAAREHSLTWIPVVLALCVLLTFAIQLALKQKDGLVTRMTISIGGALVVLALATGVLALLGLASLA